MTLTILGRDILERVRLTCLNNPQRVQMVDWVRFPMDGPINIAESLSSGNYSACILGHAIVECHRRGLIQFPNEALSCPDVKELIDAAALAAHAVLFGAEVEMFKVPVYFMRRWDNRYVRAYHAARMVQPRYHRGEVVAGIISKWGDDGYPLIDEHSDWVARVLMDVSEPCIIPRLERQKLSHRPVVGVAVTQTVSV